jgi:glycine/D-amino acid oxidase-like deaminating enzyme
MPMSGSVLATADVVVVGGGIAGLCTAWELRARGFSVVVVEQRFPTYGSSGRNPGALWVQTRRAGTELALAQLGKRKYEEYVALFGDVFDYRADGGLFFFETDEQAAVMEEYVADRRAAGLDVELIDRSAAIERSPILPASAIGAVFCADDAQVDALAFMAALEGACTRAGVRVFNNTTVLSTLHQHDRAIGVRTVRGDVHASGVVWANGAWAIGLRAEGLDVPIETTRIGQVMTQPVEAHRSPILHGPRGVHGSGGLIGLPAFRPSAFATMLPSGSSKAYETYNDTLVLNRGGSLYVGHSIDGRGSLNPHITLHSTLLMSQLAVERYPQHVDAGIVGLWAGLGSETPDGLPLVGRLDSMFLNVGHDWGVSSGPASAQLLAEIIAEQPTALGAALAPDRASLFADEDAAP